MAKKADKKKKTEYSKIIMGIILAYGILNGLMYHIEVLMGCSPDSALAVQSVITIIGAFLSYVMYQFGLKSSRNKYGIDADGQPFKEKLNDDDD